jgi:hypothetical protein
MKNSITMGIDMNGLEVVETKMQKKQQWTQMS